MGQRYTTPLKMIKKAQGESMWKVRGSRYQSFKLFDCVNASVCFNKSHVLNTSSVRVCFSTLHDQCVY